jgi:hypothetical protein
MTSEQRFGVKKPEIRSRRVNDLTNVFRNRKEKKCLLDGLNETRPVDKRMCINTE